MKPSLKRIISLFILLLLVISISACNKQTELKEGEKELDTLIKSLPSMLESDKRIFTAKIISAKDEKALINFYNIDINDYTVYEVEVLDDISGLMPDKPVYLYSIGKSEQFNRKTLKKGEIYLLNVSPWVYGDQIIYLLPTYSTSYPKLDTANRLVYTDDNESYDMCSYQEFIDLYHEQRNTFAKSHPDYFCPENILDRHITQADEILQTNSNTDIYNDPDREYEWIPSEDFIKQTIEKSGQLLAALNQLKNNNSVTLESIAGVYEN